MWTEPTVAQIAIAVIATVSGSLYFLCKQRDLAGRNRLRKQVPEEMRDGHANADRSKAEEPLSSNFSPQQIAPTGNSTDPSDAWEERRRRGIPAASLHLKKDADDKKPFGSSYYYAHNSTKTTGGYKDGLRMEDFTMNGPRLLSRNGAAVNDEEEDAATAGIIGPDTTDVTQEPVGSKTIELTRRTLYITRFLWDDPGDTSKGIGTIRIDELPCSRVTSEFVTWKDATSSIANISAMIVNNNGGLHVKIETIEVDYVLRIPQLYGEITHIEALSKAKRLLVKLTKKRSLLDKTNLKAWPHPHKQTR